MYLISIRMFDSLSEPMSGLSWCSSIATGCHSITSHLCRWNLRNFRPVSPGSVQTLALREEVDKILQKGVLEVVD